MVASGKGPLTPPNGLKSPASKPYLEQPSTPTRPSSATPGQVAGKKVPESLKVSAISSGKKASVSGKTALHIKRPQPLSSISDADGGGGDSSGAPSSPESGDEGHSMHSTPGGTAIVPGGPIYKCPVKTCGKEYAYRKGMRHHVKQKHPEYMHLLSPGSASPSTPARKTPVSEAKVVRVNGPSVTPNASTPPASGATQGTSLVSTPTQLRKESKGAVAVPAPAPAATTTGPSASSARKVAAPQKTSTLPSSTAVKSSVLPSPWRETRALESLRGRDVQLCLYEVTAWLEGVSPLIWRRILIPGFSTLNDLADTLCHAFGWTAEESHCFTSEDGQPLSLDGTMRICDMLRHAGRPMNWKYDMADQWMHVVELTKIRTMPYTFRHPMCADGERACPPEGCGGASSYRALLRHLAAKSMPGRGVELRTLRSCPNIQYHPFDPEYFSISFANARLKDRFMVHDLT